MNVKSKLFNLKNKILVHYYKLGKPDQFKYDNIVFDEYIHWYNHTWGNSRRVELPIFFYLLNKYDGKRILEVGNVTKHYKKYNHDVLDKYEKAVGIINEDIVDFIPKDKYDIVLSCSTLEHVGFDEPIKEKGKFLHAINNIKENIMKKEGLFIFSVPLKYNPEVDKAIANNQINFSEIVSYDINNYQVIIVTIGEGGFK